jgi:hypothetical protein
MDGLTEWDRTRIAVSWAAKQLSEAAGVLADTREDGLAQPGSFASEAARIRAWAELLQEYAVVLERMRGTTWNAIADSVGGRSRQSVHERWVKSEGDWRAALAGSPADMPAGTRHPDKLLRELEDWAEQRGLADDGEIMAGLDGVRARRAEQIIAPLRDVLGELLDCAGQTAVGFAGLRIARRTLEDSEATAVEVMDAASAALASLAPSLRDGSAPPSLARVASELSATLGVQPDQARRLGPHHQT